MTTITIMATPMTMTMVMSITTAWDNGRWEGGKAS